MSAKPIIFQVPFTSIGVHNGAEFRTRLLEVVCNSDSRVIIDMSLVQSIDSYAFGILMLTARTLPQHTRLVLVWKPKGSATFEPSASLRSLLNIVGTVEEARELIQSWDSGRPSEDQVLIPSTA